MKPAAEPTSPPRPPRPLRQRRRLLRLALVAAASLLVVAVLAYVFALPWLVHKSVAGALRSAGLAGATFDVRRATLFGTTLGDVSAAGGAIRVGSVDVTYRPWSVVRGELDAIVVRGADVKLGVRDGVPQLPFEVPPSDESDAGLLLPFRKLEIAESVVTVDWDGQALRVPVSGTVDSRGVNDLVANAIVRVESAAELALPGEAKLRGPGGVLRLDATVDASVSPPAGGGGSGAAWRATVRIGNEMSVLYESPTFSADAGRLTVSGTASGLTGGGAPPPSVDAVFVIEGAALKHPASKLALAGVGLRLPVTFNTVGAAAATMPAGSFDVASVTLDNEKLEPISGTIGVRDGRAEFSTRWVALPDAVLTAGGWVERDADTGAIGGELAANVPAFALDDGRLLARRIPALAGWDVTGRLGLDAKLSVTAGQPAGRVTLAAAGVDVASKDVGLELRRVNGTVAVDVGPAGVLTPARPAGPQRVTAERATFGTIEMADVAAALRLEPGNAFYVEDLSATWLGGRVSTRNVRLNPADPRFQATLVADGVSLKELLALTAQGRARGEGRMSGTVAVKVDGSNVALVGGALRSQTATGELQVLDTKWLGETMDASDPRFRADRELAAAKDRILSALADFEYDRLTFDFAEEREAGGRLTVSTHGKGRVGARPQELDLTLNFRGVNDVLRHGLRLGEGWQELTNPTIGR